MEIPHAPEQMNEHFAKAYNSGNIDNLLKLYEPNAQSVNKDGKLLSGKDTIRNDLIELLKIGGKMVSINKYVLQFENLALLKAEWKILSGDEEEGNIITSGVSAEVVRKQEGGAWLYVLDHPFSGEG